jgi:hypothetical protein
MIRGKTMRGNWDFIKFLKGFIPAKSVKSPDNKPVKKQGLENWQKYLFSIISDDETYQMTIEEKIAYSENELAKVQHKAELLDTYKRLKTQIQKERGKCDDCKKEVARIERELRKR